MAMAEGPGSQGGPGAVAKASRSASAGSRRSGKRAVSTKRAPSLEFERRWWDEGAECVVGIDEVGRGSWAGPLTVGVAVLAATDRRVNGVRDSKMLSEARREELFDRVAERCAGWAVGHAWPRECDELGMSAAQRLAAGRALEALNLPVDAVLLDGKWDFVGHENTTMLVKGDARCRSIATASILAKVSRDRMMRAAAEDHPGYDFEYNKGYPCPRHQLALLGYGPTAIHRRSWSFCDDLPWPGQRYVRPDPQLSLFG